MNDNAACCDSPRSVLRCRTISGGAKQAVTQCKNCGFYGSKGYRPVGKKDWPAQIRRVEDLPPFDDDALAAAHARLGGKKNEELRHAITDRGNPKAAAERVKYLQADLKRREAEREARAGYYASDAWAMIRQRILRRAKGICEGCCLSPAVEVHHMTYDNFGNEFMWELKAVCKPCHARYHAPQRERDEAIRRGELPYEGPVGPLLTRVIEGAQIDDGDEEESAA